MSIQKSGTGMWEIFQILIAIVVSHIKQRQKFSLIQKKKKAELTNGTEEHPDVLW